LTTYNHQLYLWVFFYVLGMALLKILASIFALRKILKRYADIHLKPLAPDGCGGLSPLGSYALLLHFYSILGVISLALRVYLDFVAVSTPVMARPGPYRSDGSNTV